MTVGPTGRPGSTAGPGGVPTSSGPATARSLGPGSVGSVPADLGADLDTSRAADLADRVAAAALTVPAVVSLHGGSLGEVATLLPGRRVRGVRLSGDDGGAQVHVVASTCAPLLGTADEVRTAVAAVVTGPVHVVVADVATPAEQQRADA